MRSKHSQVFQLSTGQRELSLKVLIALWRKLQLSISQSLVETLLGNPPLSKACQQNPFQRR